MDDIVDLLENVKAQKNWSNETFVEKVAEFVSLNDLEDEIIDFMVSSEVEVISEDSFPD